MEETVWNRHGRVFPHPHMPTRTAPLARGLAGAPTVFPRRLPDRNTNPGEVKPTEGYRDKIRIHYQYLNHVFRVLAKH